MDTCDYGGCRISAQWQKLYNSNPSLFISTTSYFSASPTPINGKQDRQEADPNCWPEIRWVIGQYDFVLPALEFDARKGVIRL